ncbi:MAG: hypothetical protein KDK99_12405 [Verrucomicrobiales bacterium]|nr:hypothetical protein [Verrucomicrobiales bacterium]
MIARIFRWIAWMGLGLVDLWSVVDAVRDPLSGFDQKSVEIRVGLAQWFGACWEVAHVVGRGSL